jgi:hypothetical protein
MAKDLTKVFQKIIGWHMEFEDAEGETYKGVPYVKVSFTGPTDEIINFLYFVSECHLAQLGEDREALGEIIRRAQKEFAKIEKGEEP